MDNTKSYGLVLEGGGAKGAYHVGALKALLEFGIKFGAVMGTSVGAINGALVAQGDFDLLFHLWENATPSLFLDIDDSKVERLVSHHMDKSTLWYFTKFISSAIKNRGLSFEKASAVLREFVNEDKLRNSPIDFGVVTVSTSGKWAPVEIFKDEIPLGKLCDYISASASFPAFKRTEIDGKSFIDGGVYDNLPINPLVRRGYIDIIALRTGSKMPHRRVVDKSVSVTYFCPSKPLGKTLAFTKETIKNNIALGYEDTISYLNQHPPH
ncbi:MAG: patatin-like phospholipase family protein [Firmicutes bacterium]|nr:patatin-like phospholipase family protein [Bacillota bacterium]